VIPYGKHNTNWADAFKVFWQVRFRSLTQGNSILKFEEEVAKYVGAKFAVAVSSATAGLHIALLAADLKPQSSVVTSPISFVASSNSILYSSCIPVFVDIDSSTLNLDIKKTIKAVNQDQSIRAIIPVHFAGEPVDMRELKDGLNRSLMIIEDAAHAMGSTYKTGEKIGSCKYSDMTVFSFHPVKSITTGEGGVVTTNDYDLYLQLLRLRSHGITKLNDQFTNPILSQTKSKVNPWYYEMIQLGFNYRMTDFQAVLGKSQLARLDRFIAQRRNLVGFYSKLLRDNYQVKSAQNFSINLSAHHIFPIRINFTNSSLSRQELVEKLKIFGIGTQVHYIPIPLHPYYVNLGYTSDEIPNAMNYYQECLTIPLYPGLRKSQQKKIIKKIITLIHAKAE
jgi:perosamine synthetase